MVESIHFNTGESIIANIFRKKLILPAVSYMIAAALLWAGLGFAPIYANAEVKYYAFVMHKPIGDSWQFLSESTTPKLGAGSYRFQIVIDSPPDHLSKWLAVRGEFLLINDGKQGGVKISVRKTLDSSQKAGSRISSSLWNDSDRNNNWEKAGQKLVQPLIDKMKLEKPTGSPVPNFMRFLVIKQAAKETWELGGKKYHLYRLHYLTKNLLSDEHKKALSRFIDPGNNPETDISQLKQWVENQDAFTLAKYLGKPDNNHKEFYQHFKIWFKQLPSKDRGTTGDGNVQTLLPDWIILFFGVLFIVIVAIIGIMVGLPNKLRRLWHFRQKNDDADALSSKKEPSLLKRLLPLYKRLLPLYKRLLPLYKRLFPFIQKREAATTFLSKPFSYVSITEFEQLKKELERLRGNLLQSQKNLEFLHKKLIALEKKRNTVAANRNNNDDNQQSSYAPIRADDFQQTLASHFSDLLHQHLTELSQHPDFKRIIKTQIDSFFNVRFKKELNQQLQVYAENYWNQLVRKPQSKEIATQTRLDKESAQIASTNNASTSQKAESADSKVIEKLKSIFLSIKSVDEDALNLLNATVEPCTFVTNVVANCLKPNQPITHYQSLDSAIKELTGSKVSLIISNVGDDIRQEEHNVVSQQTVTKGNLNIVASLIRPGVKCDNVIRRKAEVVT